MCNEFDVDGKCKRCGLPKFPLPTFKAGGVVIPNSIIVSRSCGFMPRIKGKKADLIIIDDPIFKMDSEEVKEILDKASNSIVFAREYQNNPIDDKDDKPSLS